MEAQIEKTKIKKKDLSNAYQKANHKRITFRYRPDSFDVDFMIKQLFGATDSVYPDPERLVDQ